MGHGNDVRRGPPRIGLHVNPTNTDETGPHAGPFLWARPLRPRGFAAKLAPIFRCKPKKAPIFSCITQLAPYYGCIMTVDQKQIAIITGDIVASTALGKAALDHAFTTLRSRAADLAVESGGDLHFSRHRGDGWQVVLHNPKTALRICLILRASLRALGKAHDSRMACAEGTVALPIKTDLNQEVSQPFITSGQLLQTISQEKSPPRRIVHATGGATSAAYALADHISQDWTPAQAQAINLALETQKSYSLTEIAKQLGKSRQVVTKALDAAGYPALELALTSIETAGQPHD